MCCTQLAENTGWKKLARSSPSGHHLTTLSGCIFATTACIDNRKKLVKQQYLLHVFKYGELRPISGWHRFASSGHPSKFQRVSHVGFITALDVNQTSHDVLPCPGLVHCIYIFGSSCPLREFCQVQNSLCIHVLFSLYIGSVTAQHTSSWHQPSFAEW